MTSLVVESDYFRNEHEKLLMQCIEVALTGKLQHLKVQNAGERYLFPSHCLSDGLGDCLQSLAISNCSVSDPHRFHTFHSLHKLALCRLSFHFYEERHKGQKRFEVLLDSCSSLEILSIEYSTILPLLTIDVPNQLKELTINHCKTDGIKISHAPKLNKLECFVKCAYFGSERWKLYVSTVPCLEHIRLGFDYYPNRRKSSYTLEKLAKAAPHLETLVLCFDNTAWIDPKFCNMSFLILHHLVLVEAQTSDVCSSSGFVLIFEIDIKENQHWDTLKPNVFSHDNLKVLNVKGFGGQSMEFEMNLILFMLKCTTRLERVI